MKTFVTSTIRRGAAGVCLLLAALAAVAPLACGSDEASLPTVRQVEARYPYQGKLEAKIPVSTVELRVYQPADHLRRGGDLWAKVGPYVLLFSEETRVLFEDFLGVSAVRAVTLTPSGNEVARATLPRDALNDLTWRRALAIASRARVEGTDRPSRLEALVRWGEDHTQFEYSRRYVRR